MGTRIEGLEVTKVVDGDTVKVLMDGEVETLRLTCLDTEESLAGSDKPVTNAGKLASAFARQFFDANPDGTMPAGDTVTVDIEFETDDDVETSLVKHRDNYGRLLAYVHRDGVNFCLETVRLGYSPYFDKYGRSRLFHRLYMEAEAEAQAGNRVIWDPQTNDGGPSRDYATLRPWWSMRALAVEDYRVHGVPLGVLDVRLDYAQIKAAADVETEITVFCDLMQGVHKWPGGGALIYAGSPHHKFNLWIPDADEDAAQRIIRLIERRYAEPGRGFVYVSGTAVNYGDIPQIVLTDAEQVSDFPA